MTQIIKDEGRLLVYISGRLIEVVVYAGPDDTRTIDYTLAEATEDKT